MVKYSARYTTASGGVGVINVFNSKAAAKRQVEIAKKSKAFKKLGWSRPRVVKESA